MLKYRYNVMPALVGLLLSIAIVLIPVLQQPFPSFAAGLTATPKPDKVKGPPVGTSFQYTDIETGLPDRLSVTSRESGRYSVDASMPGTSGHMPLHYRFGFRDPYVASRISDASLFSIQLDDGRGSFSNVPLDAVPPTTLATEDQLDEGQNSTLKTTLEIRSYWYRDGLVSRTPYPVGSNAVNQLEMQVFDANVGRLRTLAMNDGPSDAASAIKEVRDAINAEITAEKAITSAIILSVLGTFLSTALNNVFTQTGKSDSLRTELGLLAAVVLIVGLVSTLYNNMSIVVRQHQTALTIFNRILQHVSGGAHELTPLTGTLTPTPTY